MEEQVMDQDALDTAGQIALRAGAIISCPHCGLFRVAAFDPEAYCRAIAMTKRAWSRRIQGLDRLAREDALETVRFVIEDATWGCQGCAPTGGD
jgi:uncharacterized protein (DUF2384 family)